jgi:hypothetical protein
MVGADHALVAKAEAAIEVEARGQGAEVGLRFASGDGEALVVVGAEAGEDVWRRRGRRRGRGGVR